MNLTPNAKPADTNIVNGMTWIYSGRIWMPYPGAAAELISEASDHGWGFDDGLPPRVDSEGCVFVRILLGREAGENANDPEATSPGIQFHVTWRAPHPTQERHRSAWLLGQIFMKTSDDPAWKQTRSVRAIRQNIMMEPVTLPSVMVPANA